MNEKKESILKSAGVSEEDLEVFDVTEPLANLKKGLDVLAGKIESVVSVQNTLTDLIKSIAINSAKEFSLQKSIASSLDNMSNQSNSPKGVVNLLQKNFEINNQEESANAVDVKEYVSTLTKNMSANGISAQDLNLIANAVAAVETTGQINDGQYALYKKLKG